MRKFVFALAAGSAALATPALAQNTTGTFSGPWVGAVIGYDVSRAGADFNNADFDQTRRSIDGLLYGAAIGYDVDFGNGFFGIEGEVTDSTAKNTYARNPNPAFVGFGLGRVNTQRDFYVGARAGAKVSPNMVAYVKGGYTNARYNIRAIDGSGATFNDKMDADGWRMGAGVEYAMQRNTFAKLEYRYSNYSRAEISYPGDIPDSDRFDIDTDRHQVVASVGLRF